MGWILRGSKFPFAGCSPTGTHTHVAHANRLRILPFHDHRTINITSPDHDTTIEPTNRELLRFVLVQQIWRIHVHLSVQNQRFNTKPELSIFLLFCIKAKKKELTKHQRLLNNCFI